MVTGIDRLESMQRAYEIARTYIKGGNYDRSYKLISNAFFENQLGIGPIKEEVILASHNSVTFISGIEELMTAIKDKKDKEVGTILAIIDGAIAQHKLREASKV